MAAGADLLEEHLREIRNLRQRLEESICINHPLREQLEHWLSCAACGSGSTSNFYIPSLEPTPQLYNKNRVLKEENWSLQTQLSRVSRAPSWDACLRVPLSSELSHLVAEIRALRGQLEQSIQMNSCLRLQLEQQLDGRGSKASLSPSSAQQEDPGNKQLLLQGEVPKGTAVHPRLVTLAFQEPRKKRSHWKSFKQQEDWACPPLVQIPVC